MIQAQRSRVNQKLYHARLLLDQADQNADPLVAPAWQQACVDSACWALEQVRVAMLRELAALYRLDVARADDLDELVRLAAQRDQHLPEVALWREAQQPEGVWGRLSRQLAQLQAVPVGEGKALGDWMPEAASSSSFSSLGESTGAENLLPLTQIDDPVTGMRQLLQDIKSFIDQLRAFQWED
ncbi:hypothetical protein BFW38_04680 [Terasakiispira papahanaumokuakeensis]|uniref:Uncharacterized protein n=1 Tax=Terasakiispira papahanaumokuakeensis TaxID=197479 RepID=A0A1E2V7I8_9GAMM|nr:DUF6586 family protein [Terasakiispira papahanaumokuakeensis]ODC02947.1 hypothetical protein BFW38_04680 [Terasakiispira papahanaumokuakeensis]